LNVEEPANGGKAPRLGLQANLSQFAILVGVNALVGGMVGQERSLLSLLATQVFGLAAVSAALTYIVTRRPAATAHPPALGPRRYRAANDRAAHRRPTHQRVCATR
jgi:hypothetical protein